MIRFFAQTKFPMFNKAIIKIYWYSLWGIITSSLIIFVIDCEKPDKYETLIQNIYLSILIFLTTIIATILVKIRIKYLDFFLIACSFPAAVAYMILKYQVYGSILATFFPMIISIFYLNRKRFYFGSSLTIITFLSTHIFYQPLRQHSTTESSVIILVIIIATIFILTQTMKRGNEIINLINKINLEKQELKAQNVLMEKLSKIDALTGLYNHMTFQEYFKSLTQQFKCNEIQLNLAVLDIDNFKSVNDTYGHKVGDIVLKEVSRIIQSLVSTNDFVARYGGEEIAILFIDKSLDQSFSILENIRLSIAQTNFLELKGRYITVSGGLSSYNEENKINLFEKADEALYTAKKTGKNKIVTSNSLLNKNIN